MTLLILIIVSTMLISATCSLFEATLYSTRVGALQAAVAAGRHKKPARLFLKMKENIGSPTSAILILNTVANTAGATGAGGPRISMPPAAVPCAIAAGVKTTLQRGIRRRSRTITTFEPAGYSTSDRF